ncbi:hypothetical protein ACVRWQ_04605 [Streptococcus phocae subsp. salmonis]|uniref:hypothetical protein n=1 Tax=Streptococcus phocae TaxID=119224 RepID=UPI00053145E6|nr:hypothetical protein [Streptococcus phocae]KGR73347.1 hypothetical protein NX86_00685 [Streptococcus phocae subsp. salmonis]
MRFKHMALGLVATVALCTCAPALQSAHMPQSQATNIQTNQKSTRINSNTLALAPSETTTVVNAGTTAAVSSFWRFFINISAILNSLGHRS